MPTNKRNNAKRVINLLIDSNNHEYVEIANALEYSNQIWQSILNELETQVMGVFTMSQVEVLETRIYKVKHLISQTNLSIDSVVELLLKRKAKILERLQQEKEAMLRKVQQH